MTKNRILAALAAVALIVGGTIGGLAATSGASGYSDQGATFTLNASGQFSDSLTGDTGNATNAISYQVKIYEINTATTGSPVAGAFSPSYYGNFSNGLPTSTSFFPIGVFGQDPAGGDVPATYSNQAQAFQAMGVNVFVGTGANWPAAIAGDLAAACAADSAHPSEPVYDIGTASGNGGGTGNESTVLADMAANPSCAKWYVGNQIGDEQACGTNVAAQVAAFHSLDPTRMAESGLDRYVTPGSAACNATLLGSDIASGDVYPVTNPYLNNTGDGSTSPADCLLNAGAQNDCLWVYGSQTTNMLAAAAGTGKPVWVDLETGTDELAFSAQNGATCNTTTNLCSKGNEDRATPEQVNSGAWLSLINGANGIDWFCDDSVTGADGCVGGGGGGNVANCSPTCSLPTNLTWIDDTIESYAQELNSPDVSGVTVTSSNSAVPVDEMTKVVNGITYLFVEADRGTGTTTATYTVPGAAGSTATLVYDSAQRYDPGSGGTTTTTTQPVTTTTAAPTTTTQAPTTTTSAPTTTTTAPTTTTTTVPPSTCSQDYAAALSEMTSMETYVAGLLGKYGSNTAAVAKDFRNALSNVESSLKAFQSGHAVSC